MSFIGRLSVHLESYLLTLQCHSCQDGCRQQIPPATDSLKLNPQGSWSCLSCWAFMLSFHSVDRLLAESFSVTDEKKTERVCALMRLSSSWERYNRQGNECHSEPSRKGAKEKPILEQKRHSQGWDWLLLNNGNWLSYLGFLLLW